MENVIMQRSMGEGHGANPIPYLDGIVGTYDDRIILLFAKLQLEVPAMTHSHDYYEFYIPRAPEHPMIVGEDVITADVGKILPFNSGQKHGVPVSIEAGWEFVDLMVDNVFLEELAGEMYGRTDIIFHNRPQGFPVQLGYLFELFRQEFQNRQAGYEFILQSLRLTICVLLLREIGSNLSSQPVNERPTRKKSILRAIEYIRANYNGNEYSLDKLADIAGLSPYHFIRVFKSQTGRTPFEYLLDLKVDQAREMLKKRELNMTEVAMSCGFSSLSHFTTVFKKKVGVPPSQFYREFFGG